MDQPPLVEPPALSTPPSLPPTTSLAARLLNVFATPGEVFAEVAATSKSVANWLVPALIASVVFVTSVVILFSQPMIQQKIREQQQHAMDKNVKAGKMTQAQADEAMAMMEKFSGPGLMKIMGGIGAVVWTFASLFLWAFGLWLLGLWIFKTEISYLKAVEVVSLAGMISVLGEIVTLLLRVNLGNPSSTPSLALAVGEVDPQNPMHLILALLDVFVIWHLVVLAVGFAKLANVPFRRVILVIALIWLIVRILLMAVSLVSLKMFT